MDKQKLTNDIYKDRELSKVLDNDEKDMHDDNLDVPSDENYDRNQITISINQNYIKPYFFKYSAIKKDSSTDNGDSNYLNTFGNPTPEPKELELNNNQDLNANEIKTNRPIQDTNNNNTKNNNIKANKNWGIILNTIFLINRMKNVQVKRIKTNDLEEHYEKWFLKQEIDKTVSLKSNFTFQCLKESKTGLVIPSNFPKQYKLKNDEELIQLEFFAKQIKFFEYLSSGEDENFDEINELVNNDPNKYMFDSSQKNKFFVNQKNIEFVSPLYVATINGHLKIVKFLCDNGADILMKNGVIYY